jgi:hypothetical protein
MKTAADELAIDRNVLIEWLARGPVVIADANNFAVFVAQIQNGLLFRHVISLPPPIRTGHGTEPNGIRPASPDDANPTC